MKRLNWITRGFLLVLVVVGFSACFEDDLMDNPNASVRATPTTVLNRLTATTVLKDEMPFNQAHRTNQYYVSNYSYYWGSNYYNWTSTADRYEMLRYAIKLEEEAGRQYGDEDNVYKPLAQFFRAYSSIWFSQRVGDIISPKPLSGAGLRALPKTGTKKVLPPRSTCMVYSRAPCWRSATVWAIRSERLP